MAEIWLGMLVGLSIFRDSKKDVAWVISSPGFICALIAAWCAKISSKTYFLDIRDIYPDVFAEAGILDRDGKLYRFLDRLTASIYANALGIICPTHGLKEHVAKRGGQSVEVIYNGFPEMLMEMPGEKREKFTLCFHGILSVFQDVETIVALAAYLKPFDIDIVVVGYGKKESLIANAEIDNLHFYGKRSFEETIAIVSSCHIGLCLRRDEAISKDAFPVKVWECLGLGMPSVVTPICEAGDFLEKNQCGTQFDSGDVVAIGEYVRKLKSDDACLRSLQQKASEVRKGYTREIQGALAGEYFLEGLLGAEMAIQGGLKNFRRAGQ
jgi:glycosyltransferase involved in cell wall biosynthesis